MSTESVTEHLTDREKEVLTLISNGWSIVEIARLIDRSPSTVKSHTKNIYVKLDVNNMVGAVARALREGIIE